jgi:hypothetical protein
LYFPAIFDDARSKELYDILKQRAKTMLDCIIDGETQERTKRVEELTDMMITFSKPKNFTGTGSLEIEYDKQFEDMCIIISKNLHTDPKKYNVLEYYNAYLFISKQEKERKRQNKAR